MAYGLIVGPGSYLRRQWTNALDLTLVVLGCARAHSRSLFGSGAAVSPCLRPCLRVSVSPYLCLRVPAERVCACRLVRAGQRRRAGEQGPPLSIVRADSLPSACGSEVGLSAPSVRGACGSRSAPWPPQPIRASRRPGRRSLVDLLNVGGANLTAARSVRALRPLRVLSKVAQ